MDLVPIWNDLAHGVHSMPRFGLLLAAVVAMIVGLGGSLLVSRVPVAGRILRQTGTLALAGVLVLVILQLSRLDPHLSVAGGQSGLPTQVVTGNETRIPMANDGHFWLKATVNGHQADFLIDTGATLTAISSATAAAAGLRPDDGGMPVHLQTANGPVEAKTTTIADLRFGNVTAQGIRAVIAPGLGSTNVIGMNVLSRLAAVRLEGHIMVLVPRNRHVPPAGDGTGGTT